MRRNGMPTKGKLGREAMGRQGKVKLGKEEM